MYFWSQVDYDKHDDFNRKRCDFIVCACLWQLHCSFLFSSDHFIPNRHSTSRSGNSAGRVKRVVSCKRKTHHGTIARRKQLGPGRSVDAANKENEMKLETFFNDPSDFPLNANNNYRTSGTGSEQSDSYTLIEVTVTVHTFCPLLIFVWNCLNS